MSALLIDYGGVLTCPIEQAHRSWSVSEGVTPGALDAVLREWRDSPPAEGNPVHLVETGEISPDEFERRLAAGLRRHGAGRVAQSGLLSRIFAHFTPDPNMIAAVREVRALGFRTVLVTNSWGSGQPWRNIADAFDAYVVSYQVGVRKPDRRIFTIATQRAGVPPNRCVFVDDLIVNVQAAAALTMIGVHHVDPGRTRVELNRYFALRREGASGEPDS